MCPMVAGPARAHAIDLVMIGHLLNGRLVREGVCSSEQGFARVWRDCVVPLAAAAITEWRLGMCAEIHGLTTPAGMAFNNVVGRINGRAGDGERWEVIAHGPDGFVSANLKPDNLKPTARPTAILFLWRQLPLDVASPANPYEAVRDALWEAQAEGSSGALPVTVLSGFLGAGKVWRPQASKSRHHLHLGRGDPPFFSPPPSHLPLPSADDAAQPHAEQSRGISHRASAGLDRILPHLPTQTSRINSLYRRPSSSTTWPRSTSTRSWSATAAC